VGKENNKAREKAKTRTYSPEKWIDWVVKESTWRRSWAHRNGNGSQGRSFAYINQKNGNPKVPGTTGGRTASNRGEDSPKGGDVRRGEGGRG